MTTGPDFCRICAGTGPPRALRVLPESLATFVAVLLVFGGPARAQTAVAAPAVAAAENPGPNRNIVRWARGAYGYMQIKEERLRGREEWQLFAYRDGSRTMIMWHDIWARNTQFTSVMRVAADFRPLEAYVSYWTPSGFKGSGLMIVRGDHLDVLSYGPAGTVNQSIEVKGPFSISTHPLASDGWHYWFYDKKKGGDQMSRYFSIEASGDLSLPIVPRLIETPQAYAGEETITVPAGTFRTSRYNSGGSSAWIGTDDSIVIKSTASDGAREYVLIEYQQGSSPLTGTRR